MVSQKRSPRSTSEVIAASTNSAASPSCAPRTVSSLTSGAPARAAASSADSAMRRSSGGSQGSWLEVLADQRAGHDAEHAIEGRIGHADDAVAVRQHHAFVHDLDGQRLAAQHFFVRLAIGDVVHHADEAVDDAVERDDRLVGQMDPARVAAQCLQRHLHLGAFALAQALATLDGAGVVGREKHVPPAEAVQLLERAAEECLQARTGPDDLGFAVGRRRVAS